MTWIHNGTFWIAFRQLDPRLPRRSTSTVVKVAACPLPFQLLREQQYSGVMFKTSLPNPCLLGPHAVQHHCQCPKALLKRREGEILPQVVRELCQLALASNCDRTLRPYATYLRGRPVPQLTLPPGLLKLESACC